MNMKLLPVLAATMCAIILSSCSYGRTYTSYKAPLALRAYEIEERDTYVYYSSLPALRVYKAERRRAARDYEAQRLRAARAYEAERRRASRIYETGRRRAARQSYTLSNTTLPNSQPEVMVKALLAVWAAQEHAGECCQDAAADGGQAWLERRPGLGWAAAAFSPRAAGAGGRRRRAGRGGHGGAGRASSGPRNGPGPARPSSAGASARRPSGP